MLAVTLVALPAAALVIGAGLRSPLARRIVARPSGERWHREETPMLGGVGIFAGLLAGVGAAIAAGAVDADGELAGILGGAALLFALGLADDAFGLSPLVKLAGQLAAVGIVLACGLRVEAVGNDVLATAIAVVWLVGMTNALNFLDNMDGVAATFAAVAAGLFAIDAAGPHPSRQVLVLALALACSCAGFLPFNLRRGRRAAAFMGDSGSQVLGFALGSLALLSTWKASAPSLAALLLPILVLAVPILDTTLVTIVRLLERRPIYAGGRDHMTHRLVYGGLSEQRAVVVVAVLAAAVGGAGLVYGAVDSVQLTLAGVIVTFAILAQLAGALATLDEHAARDWQAVVRALEAQSRRALYVAGDFVLVGAAFVSAYLIRFGGVGPVFERHLFLETLPVVLASRYAFFILFGLYSGSWLRFGRRDAARIAAAVAVSEGIAVALIALSDKTAFDVFSRSVFAIDFVLCTLLVGLSRWAAPSLARLLPGSASRRAVAAPGPRADVFLRELDEAPAEEVARGAAE